MTWQKWQPMADVAPEYRLIKIADIVGSFSIILADQSTNQQLTILFKDSVNAHRVRIIDKEHRSLEQDQICVIDAHWPFFKSSDSLYLQSLIDQSYGAWDSPDNCHFLIRTKSYIIDIFAEYEPTFYLVSNSVS